MKHMLCECGNGMVERTASPKEPYRYTMSGLPNIGLLGIKVSRCEACGVEVPVIPHVADLHRAIAYLVVDKPGKLTGAEVRFLRKHAGFPGNKFAILAKIGASHLSRVENGEKSLSPAVDRLVRAISMMAASDVKGARDVLLAEADRIHQARKAAKKKKAGSRQGTLFCLEGKAWKKAG